MNSGSGLHAALRHLMRDGPGNAQQGDESNDSLRDNAVKAPDLQDGVFDAGETKGEGESENGGARQQDAPAQKRQKRDEEITGDADGGDGNMRNFGVRAVVHNAAIPMFVDGAGFGRRGIVDAQRQG